MEGRQEVWKEARKEGRRTSLSITALSWQICSPAVSLGLGLSLSLSLQPEVQAASGSTQPPSLKPDKAPTDAGSVFKGLRGLKDDGNGDPVYQPSSRFSVLLAVAEINELLPLLLLLLQ